MAELRTSSNLLGMHVSQDNGASWSQFVGASGPPSEFDIYRDQGTYNSIVTVKRDNPEEILIGGIDIWKWKQTVNDPLNGPTGGFEKISQWFASPSSSIYVHADNHEMKWDNANRLYVGNDGGIGITEDGVNWYPANRGYNVTQFYGIAFDRNGAVMGGAQDNGTIYNDHSLSTFQEFREVNGGDGFECEISFYNPKVMFSSVYYNSISRSGDKGQTWSSFTPASDFPASYPDPGSGLNGVHPFHTEFILAEHYDLKSKDSVSFIARKNYKSGDLIKIPSMATGDSISYIATKNLYFDDTLFYDPSLTSVGINYGKNPATGEIYAMGSDTVAYNVAWDTLRVQDPYQSWFVVFVNINGGELWATRDALRLAAPKVQWVCIARGIGGPSPIGSNDNSNIDMEFSADLKHLFIVTSAGVTRISGLGDVYSSEPNFKTKVGYSTSAPATSPTATTTTKISNASYEGLAVNPRNPDDLLLLAGFSGVNRRTTNASTATSTANLSSTILQSITNPGVACYDGIIDRLDENVLVVGTSSGVFVSEDGGVTWENASAGFEGTPVFEVRQQWRSFDQGSYRSGEIYVGTYGRGIWSTTAYLGINDNKNDVSLTNFKTKLKSYPNPTNDNTTLSFQLAKTGDVEINVYSITGRLVKSISKKNVSSGENTLFIDSEDMPNGTYIVKFVSGKQVESVKFIKM